MDMNVQGLITPECCLYYVTARTNHSRRIPIVYSLPRLQARFQSNVPNTSTPPPAVPTPSVAPTTLPESRQSKWRQFLQILGRTTLIVILTTGGVFYYVTQKDRHPGDQLPNDPTRKNLVILGSGWGATSLLKAIDTTEFNVTVISPKNFFLFTPLLPSVAVGTLGGRSIIQPTRFLVRHKARRVTVVEAEAQSIDVYTSAIKPPNSTNTIHYDYLVCAVGSEIQTFGIPGVKEHGVFMKELGDAEKFQDRIMDCIETAAFPDQTEDEIERLLHLVVVGGGPTGIEVSGEFHDFLKDDLTSWYPELAPKMRITLIEALPSVLPMFSKSLIAYTESTFKEENIEILTGTMVKEVKEKGVVVQKKDGTREEIPFGVLVWAGGNKPRKLVTDLMTKLSEHQTNKRGLVVDDNLAIKGSDSIYALGDCTSTAYAPTAQVASQQGAYLGRVFNRLGDRDKYARQVSEMRETKEKMIQQTAYMVNEQELHGIKPEWTETSEQVLKQSKDLDEGIDRLNTYMNDMVKVKPFHYSHQGSLAYIGSDRAIADLSIWEQPFASHGALTYVFWRSAYLSTLFSLRNRTLVATDWLKVKLFGR
ncbi:NDE2, mitochondrial external NADH dehydrogenase [Hysterangium stoloniferum]|nr:NDE2, mitochondrial external NADH dehydrogenase [Hysterangium stoloniferum]